MNFKPITLADKNDIDSIVHLEDKQGTEYCFTSLYAWAMNFNSLWCPHTFNGRPGFVFCSGDYGYLFSGSPDPVLINDWLEKGEPFALISLNRQDCDIINNEFPSRFDITANRDSFDYIYLAEDLLTLKGKKLQSKRNHLNSFLREYPHSTVEPITEKNVDACKILNEQWCAAMNCGKTIGLQQETCAVRRTLNDFTALQVDGLLARIDGQPVAYTVGELLNSNTFLVHIEKALSPYKGLYQFINQAFVKYILQKYPQVVYINREDDNGDQGLRLAKLSYQPVYLLEKFVATPR